MNDVKIIFAQNLISLRKQSKLTQIDLAERLNYSDKAISKWERGESIPDVTVLMQIAELFGVSLDFLVTAHSEPEIAAEQTNYAKAIKKRNRIFVTAITIFAIAVLETILFVIFQPIFKPALSNLLFCYVYPLPVIAIVLIVFSSLWGGRLYRFCSVTGLILTLLLDAFLIVELCTGEYYFWIFLVAIPAELVTMFSFGIIRLSSFENKKKTKED